MEIKFSLDITMLKSFADRNEHHLGEPVWEIMRMIGSDLVDFITSMRSRLDIVSKYTEVWEEINEDNRFKVLFLQELMICLKMHRVCWVIR